jgi:hypothetical protein
MESKPYQGSLRDRLAFSEVLFNRKPTRREMMRLRPSWACRLLNVRVHRNHSIEHVASALVGWAAYGACKFVWSEAPYDNSLSMVLAEINPDLEVIWYDVDTIRSQPEIEVLEWLRSRVQVLRRISASPILVAIVGLTELEENNLSETLLILPGVRVAPVAKVLASLSRPYNSRLLKISGARLSEAANLLLAKHLACRWLPALLSPRVKAIIVDLD